MYMNTHTILNIKTDKKLKEEAKKISSELGVPLGTVVNALLKQFVRDKEIILSVSPLQPTPYLERIIAEAEAEYKAGLSRGPMSAKEVIAHLKTL
jgi:addiction module RelB/DinJ family antitoxin